MPDINDEVANLIGLIRRNRAVLERDEPILDHLKHRGIDAVAADFIAYKKLEAELHSGTVGDTDLVRFYREELERFSEINGDDRDNKIAALAVKAMYEYVPAQHIEEILQQYIRDPGTYESAIADRIRSLDLTPFLTISEPTADDIENLDLERPEFDEQNRQTLISAERLPLRLLASILRSPHEVRNITPRQFEEFIAEILSQLGFSNVLLTPRAKDGGKDIIASHQVNGISLAFYFECKQYAEDNKIQLETLRALLGTMAHDSRSVNKGILVTTSSFTRGCRDFILSEARIGGKDYSGVLGWIEDVNKKI